MLTRPELIDWLNILAAGCQCEPSHAVVKAYLEQLEHWDLSHEQWRQLRIRAVMRHKYPRLLPMISDLYDIARELCEEADARRKSEQATAMLSGPREPVPEEVRQQFRQLSKHVCKVIEF
jgi:hypothetical protein